MADFKKYPNGKDQNINPGIELGGSYHEDVDILIALSKALVKAGLITKQEIIDEL